MSVYLDFGVHVVLAQVLRCYFPALLLTGAYAVDLIEQGNAPSNRCLAVFGSRTTLGVNEVLGHLPIAFAEEHEAIFSVTSRPFHAEL